MTKQYLFALLIVCVVINFHSIDVYGWHQLPGNGLEVDAIAANADESRIILGLRNGGFWQTDDSGENWIPINDRVLPPNASTFFPRVIDELYMLDSEGDTIVTRYQCDRSVGWAYSISTDGGNSWDAVMPPNRIYNTQNEYLIIDPTDHYRLYYSNATHFTYSLDFGTTWEDTFRIDSLGISPTDFVIDSFHPDTLFRVSYSPPEISFSYNRGITWNSVSIADCYGMSIVKIKKILPLSNGTILAFPTYGIDSENNYHAFSTPVVSMDGGQSWAPTQASLPVNFNIYEAIESPYNDGGLFISGKGGRFSYTGKISSNYGQDFEDSTVGLPEPFISIFGLDYNSFSNTIYMCSSGHGVFKSTNGGNSWGHFETVEPLGQFGNFTVNEYLLSTSGYLNHLNVCYDFNSNDWINLNQTNVQAQDSISFLYPISKLGNGTLITHVRKQEIGSGNYRIFVAESSDNGETWDDYDYTITGEHQSTSEGFICQYFGEDNSRLIRYERALNNLIVHTSLDTGRTWINQSTFPLGAFIKSTLQTETKVYLVVDNINEKGIYMSDDNCQTWTNINFPNSENISDIDEIEIDPSSGKLYILTDDSCFSFDSESWVQLGNVTGVFDIAVMPNGESPIIVGSCFNQMLKMSLDGGNTWTRQDSCLPYHRQIGYIFTCDYDPWRDRIWVSTSIGMMYAEREDLLSVDDPGSAFIPLEHNPIQAYPNPFNSSINITYYIEIPGSVELKLFNLSGQEIASLYSGNRNRGRYELTYDASHLASGTYFLKLDEGGAIHTQKVTLVK